MTENDRKFGPITIGPWRSRFGIEYSSADFDYREIRDRILITGFGWAIRIAMPFSLLKPIPGLSGHNSTDYGISLNDMGNGYDFFIARFGPQTYDSSTTRSWSWFLPWKQWRHIRTSYYDRNGDHFFTSAKGTEYSIEYDKQEQCSKRKFEFVDFDGETITATTHIEEREWHRGTGWFKWLKLFFKPLIRRSLDIHFSSEVGPKKGSWKGGTIAHGTDMAQGESHEAAFRRYCEAHALKFVKEL